MRSASFMRPPEDELVYKVGDKVEVNCDHEDKDAQRVRDWLKGTVVQIEDKLIAVHSSRCYLTTAGWCRITFCGFHLTRAMSDLTSHNVRNKA